MKRRHLIQLLAAGMLLCVPATAMSAPRGWETVKTERPDAKPVARDSEIEIKTARGVIIVSSNHSVQVKVFTILGQLISSDTVGAGTSQLLLGAHGVYIVKAGDITCKVAL